MFNFFYTLFMVLTVGAFFQVARSFTLKSTYLLKLHGKYAFSLFVICIIFNLYKMKIAYNFHNNLFEMYSIVFGIIILIDIDICGFDVFTRRHYLALQNKSKKYGLRRDFFSMAKIGLIFLACAYIFYRLLFKFYTYQQGLVILIFIVTLGAINTILMSKFHAICPFCDTNIKSISGRYRSIKCPVCNSKIIIDNNELVRPRGRSANMENSM